ncbi:MFS transporter [Saccharopolyspora rhizosphaerae]|uniref:MFS transporter n=1 Tax=Saccharopolyspora rhizosphaerae TaxID=2492662 RepID=A0A426JHN7_9PSEU|nr:MFS transporter [Saccharopolyspora rhizosphaerae]RRO12675.1 MFS transporter [Saccharopolyspora rhizosphaerae]
MRNPASAGSPTPLRQRSFRFLLIATIGGFSGYALLLPVVPLWAVAGGAGEVAAGATNAVFMLVTVLTQLVMPWLLARVDCRALFALGTAVIGAPTPLFALSSDLWVLLGVSALRGIGFGLLTVTGSALTAELVPVAQRGRAAGYYGLAIGLPNVALLPAGVWLSSRIGFEPLFWASGVVPVVAALSVIGIERVRIREQERAAPAKTASLLPSWTIMTANTAAAGGLTAFLPLAVDPSIAPAALLIFAGMTMLGRWLAGHLGDRFGQRRVLAPSVLLGGFGVLLIALAAWLADPVALLGAGVFGAGFGAMQNTTLILMLERVDSATASTAWNIAYDGGHGLGAIGFGVLIAASGYPVTFAVAGAVLIACRALAIRRWG